MSKKDYLERVLKARVYDVAQQTPLELAPGLSRRLGNRLLLKREDLQPVFSFKLRGAYNKMSRLAPAKLKKGVITASAGNHAQGVALAARKLGCRAVIVMPVTTPKIKVDAVLARGAEAVLRGDSYSDAYAHALELEARRGLSFVHPFDDPDVIAGNGSVGLEILDELPDVDVVVVGSAVGRPLASTAAGTSVHVRLLVSSLGDPARQDANVASVHAK
jgi:threonine dehydratase